jgi:futalosine hydrolase
MSALIVSATEMEVAPFRNQFPEASCLITGVGMPMAIFQITKKLREQNYDVIFQVGIAGTYTNELQLGETVVVAKDSFADLGLCEGNSFRTLFDMGFASPDEFPFSKGWLINEGLHQFQPLPAMVSAATVNTISDERQPQSNNRIKAQSSIETMEGACLHYVALQNEIPFLQIRGISNAVGERDKSFWKIAEAVESSNKLLAEVYKNWLAHSKA